jgi:hypothetical protein
MRAGTKIRFVLTLFVCTWAVAQQPTSPRLTLKDAIDLALKNNLSVLAAGTQAGEAAGSTDGLSSHCSVEKITKIELLEKPVKPGIGLADWESGKDQRNCQQ